MKADFLIDMLIIIEATIVTSGAILGRDIRLGLVCLGCVVAARLGIYFMDQGGWYD